MTTETICTERKPLNELDFGPNYEEENGSDDTGEESLTVKKFMDDDEDDKPEVKKKNVRKHLSPIIGERPLTDYIFTDVNKYSFKTWSQCFPDNKITLRSLIFNPAWYDFFDIIEKKPYFVTMEKKLANYLVNDDTILPFAELVFNALNILSPKQIKVVFIGQDPYPGAEKINNKLIPQAMGFSFSVPLNYPKPLSLANIYQNLLDFGHIKKIPNTGCLSYWVLQGCLMLNAYLTTIYTKKKEHTAIWKNFTDDLIMYINNKCDNIVFVAWGGDAHMLCQKIDPYKHHIMTTSHPSPLGYDKTLNGYAYGKFKNPSDKKRVVYPTFKSTDHFGRINSHLKSINKREIIWDLFEESI